MIYEWGRHSLRVPAQTVGETVERLAQDNGGVCAPSALVDEARPDDSPLHPLFLWDDEHAAELYRRDQARDVVQSLVIVVEQEGKEPERLPAFYSVSLARGDASRQRGYQSIAVVRSNQEASDSAAHDLLSTLKGLQRRYDALAEFAPVWGAVEQVEARLAS